MAITDILIIGAGPAGLSIAAECSYHELGSILVLEQGKTHNQTVRQYYPDDKRVDAAYRGQEAVCAGVLCFRDTTKANFMAIVDQMLATYRFPIRFETTVDSIRKTETGLFQVSSTAGHSYEALVVVIAIGRMGKPNRPDYFNTIPSRARVRVHFDVKNLDATGKRILVVGGGNSAAEFALSLAQRGNVTLSYRQTDFHRLNPMNLHLLKSEEAARRIEILRNSNIEKISEADGVPLVHFKNGGTQSFDHVIFGIGGSSPTALFQNAGCKIDEKGNLVLNKNLETTVPGLFAVGDIAVAQGKGSIIQSFNTGKLVADSIAEKLGLQKKPELVHYIPRRYFPPIS